MGWMGKGGEETFKLGAVGGWLATVDFAECENALMFCKPSKGIVDMK